MSENQGGRWIQKIGSKGNKFSVWEKAMPRIDPRILDCTAYLYPNKRDASTGVQAGGTGFLVVYPSSKIETPAHLYIVTAKHVVITGRCEAARVNTKQGDYEILDVSTGSWIHHPDGDDLAVCPIRLDINKYKFSCIPSSMLLTKRAIAEHQIGVGDEVFMVGRFINHDGKQKNTPTARFGNISMMPDEPIRHPTGIMQESFVVEARSFAGFSGSPVFVWIPGSDQRTNNLIISQGWGPWSSVVTQNRPMMVT
jgi:hypothetical protein